MVDNSPESLHNNLKKNPFKKIFDNVKKFIKKDEDNDKNPVLLEAPEKEKKAEKKKPVSSEMSKKRQKGQVKKTENPKDKKVENTETEKSESTKRERRGKANEQKLPKKFRKGW